MSPTTASRDVAAAVKSEARPTTNSRRRVEPREDVAGTGAHYAGIRAAPERPWSGSASCERQNRAGPERPCPGVQMTAGGRLPPHEQLRPRAVPSPYRSPRRGNPCGQRRTFLLGVVNRKLGVISRALPQGRPEAALIEGGQVEGTSARMRSSLAIVGERVGRSRLGLCRDVGPRRGELVEV